MNLFFCQVMPREDNPHLRAEPGVAGWGRGEKRREGQGTGEAGALPPPSHCTAFSPPHVKTVCRWRPTRSRGLCPQASQMRPLRPLPRSETFLPQPGGLRPGMGLRLWVADPPRSLGRGSSAESRPHWGPSRATFYLDRRSTRRRRKNGQRAQRPCWAAARGVRGCSDLRRPLCLWDRLPWPASRPDGCDRQPARGLPCCGLGGGRGPEGRDVGTGRAQASNPPAAALRRPGVGSPAVPPAAGRALGGDSEWPVAGHLRQVAAASQGNLDLTLHLGGGGRGSEAWRERRCQGREGVGAVSVYIFFIQQMPLKWLLPLFP